MTLIFPSWQPYNLTFVVLVYTYPPIPPCTSLTHHHPMTIRLSPLIFPRVLCSSKLIANLLTCAFLLNLVRHGPNHIVQTVHFSSHCTTCHLNPTRLGKRRPILRLFGGSRGRRFKIGFRKRLTSGCTWDNANRSCWDSLVYRGVVNKWWICACVLTHRSSGGSTSCSSLTSLMCVNNIYSNYNQFILTRLLYFIILYIKKNHSA